MQIDQVLRGRVRYGQAIMRLADNVRCEVPVVIKEYDRQLVEQRRTRNGELVGEDAKEELRIHQLLSSHPSSITNIISFATHSANHATQPPNPNAPTSFLLSTGHPHLVHLFDVRKDAQMYYAILEYCALGEFFPLVQRADFTPALARHYFRQLMLGLQYMHWLGIAHRDLSLENILLDERKNLKICDFGVAIECKAENGGVDGLIRDEGVPVGKVKFYMPPEVFNRLPYSPAKVDVWTSGIILFVMLTKVHPFKYATHADQRFMMVYNGQMADLLQKWGKEPLHPYANDILNRMLCPPEYRITVNEILNHPYTRETTNVPTQMSTAADEVVEEEVERNSSGGSGISNAPLNARPLSAISSTSSSSSSVAASRSPLLAARPNPHPSNPIPQPTRVRQTSPSTNTYGNVSVSSSPIVSPGGVLSPGSVLSPLHHLPQQSTSHHPLAATSSSSMTM